MYIYSYLYYDVTQVTIIKDYLLTYLLTEENQNYINMGLTAIKVVYPGH